MCGIVTICNYQKDIRCYHDKLIEMNQLLENRGPDESGEYVSKHCMMAHRRLSIIDLNGGQQPMSYMYEGRSYHITYNGEIYNMIDIKNQLISDGYRFYTMSDTEVIIVAYIAYKEKCVHLFEGIFAFVIDDGQKLFIARDPLGVKPLFYYVDSDETMVIASEIKSILCFIGKAIVDKRGIKELLGLGPSLTPEHTLYKNIYSLRAGYYMYYQKHAYKHQYFMLEDKEHTDSIKETIYKVRKYVIESIEHQLLSDVPITSMLSGGLDSSILSAIAYQYKQPLSTYSITYEDQDKYFKAYDYQTTQDDVYIHDMIEMYPTKHHEIVLKQSDLIDSLKEAMIARDMPGMADIDSSFLLFSKEIAKTHKVCLSGECADEIFGGYPWFYKEELYHQPYFPWMRDIDLKIDLFHENIKALNIKDYIINAYQQSLHEINTIDKKKQLIYLNIQWFMQTLLTRTDSQTMRSSIEVRVPFASTKLLQYLYNMPYDYMFYNNEEKGILREAFKDILPQSIIHRKKNPYPKTHSPIYLSLIEKKLEESLSDSSNILLQLFDQTKLLLFIHSHGQSFNVPWFGQLMMGPQLMAYFYQIYLWGKIYHIQLEL
ncbi:MAG: asparagine synthase (glutamine-hydrolyzing) [Erysipelotrichaceae bacterium]|nr:asparagine synthase (glutamine-hydrolyzing) [Erysipelotrichaceae bacterium]